MRESGARLRRDTPGTTLGAVRNARDAGAAEGVVPGIGHRRRGLPGDRADVDRAIAVREAVYRLVTARRLGEEYADDTLDVLNGAARKPPAAPQLTASGRRTEATPDEALSTVARQAIELLSGPDVPLLKECGNPECTRIYIDRSRGMRRQWCGMESCGNKIKAAAYRARKKSAHTAAAQ